MPYYPETTVLQPLAHVVRERRMPKEAIPHLSHLVAGTRVQAMNVVLEGDILRKYRILDVAAALRESDPARLAEYITIEEGQRAQAGQELARRGRGRRAKVLLAPASGLVVRIRDGRIVLQVSERTVEVQAKIPGEIEKIESHMVQVVGNGAIMQCAWGNGRFCYEAFKFLPDDGFVGLSRLDPRISEYRGVVVISPIAVNKGDLLVAQQQEAAGVVAPGMPSDLREFALGLTFPVLLTEGFGQKRPTALIYNLLRDNMGRQAAFDAITPERWSGERPEIMIPLPHGGATPPIPTLDRTLEIGAQVRILRAPWDGLIGEVVELPETPQVIGNGLRVPSATVRLPGEQRGLVPLANLELLG
ncbi:MAG: hypothetical protein EHM39_05655 [Chloroflexi bacterium]|nr:MAG: hypothetical protein EHM39_05655 [Chloroflexota bacterium]